MKKILITVAFACIASLSFGQLNVGAKVGMNFSKLSTDWSDLKTSMQPGADVGVFLRIKLASKLYLQPEVLYSFQSSKWKDIPDEWSNDTKLKRHNILVPVHLGYKILDAKMFNLRAYLGPNFGFIIDNNSTYDFSVVNIAGDIGIGVDIAMITIDVKYSYGFNNMAKDKEVSLGPIDVNLEAPKFHNNLFSISVGWKFL